MKFSLNANEMLLKVLFEKQSAFGNRNPEMHVQETVKITLYRLSNTIP